MTRRLDVHPTHPQARLLRHAAECLRDEGVAIYPTDSTYALGCLLDARDGQTRIHRIRQDRAPHLLTLLCRDLSELATYARVGNQAYRLLKALTPGPYTFILQASRELPKRILDAKRKTIGLRIPEHPVTQGLLADLGAPLLSASLIHDFMTEDDADPEALFDRYGSQVDVFLAAGSCGIQPTTMIALSDEASPRLLRQGRGDVSRIADLEGA
ncbi:MAG: threonylcarbamoyl-AMP synthase [Gammaproteobacteria bacterium]|nr:threonylcarbamoyl-AMP synthase [Gammaproteobacteria bacterium]